MGALQATLAKRAAARRQYLAGFGARHHRLAVTLVVSTLTFGGDRTNMLQGAVHIVMFLVFGLLLFHP